MNKRRITQAAIVFFILVFPSLLYVIMTTGNHDIARLPFIGPRKADLTNVDKNGIPDTTYYRIDPISFIDINGDLVDENRLKGKHLIVDFVCTECNEMSPRITHQMVSVQERFLNKEKVAMISVLIDTNETKEKVLDYKAGLNVKESDNWYFVKGSSEEVKLFGENLLLNNTSSNPNAFETNTISVVDRDRHIRGHFDGKQYVETKEVIDMVKALLFVDFKATKKNKKDEELVRKK